MLKYMGGNSPGGNFPGGNLPGGNSPGGNFPGGNCPGGIHQGGIFRESSTNYLLCNDFCCQIFERSKLRDII